MRSELTAQAQPQRLEKKACPNNCVPADSILWEFDPYRVCRCTNCGLVRLNPRLSEDQLPDLYEGGYFSGEHSTGYDSYEQDESLYERTSHRRLKLIRRFQQTGRLLDIGCGLGYFMNVAARKGFEVYGLDVSRYAVERCEARFPGRMAQGSLLPHSFPKNSFDVVTMSDLFEHVYHPHEFVQTVHAILRDGGIAAVTTPNYHSLLSRVSGRNWVSYKIPEHVYYYTPQTLRDIVTPLFSVELLRSAGQYCSLEFLAERVKTISRPLGSAMLSSVRRLGLKDMSVYVSSGSMTIVLRKR